VALSAVGSYSFSLNFEIYLSDMCQVNNMVAQLTVFAREVSRVALEVGTKGILGGSAQVEGVGGVWLELTTNVNQ
jgi:hypothetical protein